MVEREPPELARRNDPSVVVLVVTRGPKRPRRVD